jgi:hypothetical protein
VTLLRDANRNIIEIENIMKTETYEEKQQSQLKPGYKPGAPPAQGQKGDMAEMMKKMEAAGTPGPAHKALQSLVGNWKAEVKCWMDPAAPPDVSPGTAKTSSMFNGRFLEEEFHGQMMGKPFTGKWLMGYDNVKQTFNSVWISDSQTSMFFSEGRGDSANKVITMEGKATCAATGGKDIPMKSVLRVNSPDQHVFEMYDGSKGNVKTMEITYTRQ